MNSAPSGQVSANYGNIFVHEYNHTLGYTHDGTLTYSDPSKPDEQRLDVTMGKMLSEYWAAGKLPYGWGKSFPAF